MTASLFVYKWHIRNLDKLFLTSRFKINNDAKCPLSNIGFLVSTGGVKTGEPRALKSNSYKRISHNLYICSYR